MLANKDSISRRLAISMSVMAIVSALASFRFSGFWPTCTSNILFYRGSARFSDLLILLTTSAPADPYSVAFEYPPGSLPVIRFFGLMWSQVPSQTGVAWLYETVGHSVPQDLIQSCQAEPLLWAHLVLVGFGLVSVVLLIFSLFAAGFRRATRWLMALTGGGIFLLVFSLLEMYAAVLFVAGVSSLLILWMARQVPSVQPAYALVPLVASAYPIIFGVDRGNLDIVILPLLIGFAVIIGTTHGRVLGNVAAACLGVAVAVKLWPIFLLGALMTRSRRWELLLTFGVSSAVVTVAGAHVISDDWVRVGRQFIEVFGGNGAAVTSDWLLAFNYTWGAGLSYLIILAGGQEMLETLRPLWLGFQQFLILIAPVVAALVFFIRRPFWEVFTLASGLFLMLTSFAPPYRVTVLVIAAGLMVRHFRGANAQPSKLELGIATVLGLAIAPTYLWTLPGITPLGVAPSGTIVGAFFLLCLNVLLIINVVRHIKRSKNRNKQIPSVL